MERKKKRPHTGPPEVVLILYILIITHIIAESGLFTLLYYLELL